MRGRVLIDEAAGFVSLLLVVQRYTVCA